MRVEKLHEAQVKGEIAAHDPVIKQDQEEI